MKKKAFSVLATTALAMFIATGSADAATESYTVKTGDTLWKIASQHKLSVDELKSLNNLSSDMIKVDQKLNVTAKADSYPTPIPSKKDEVMTSSTNSWENLNTGNGKAEKLSPTAENILLATVDVSLPLLDTPYVWAGATKDGFDCSGFIYYVYQAAGLDLPRFDTISMYTNSSYVDEPKPGDLVFFENTYRKGISHVGIYIGNNKFIHAGGKQSQVTSLSDSYWKSKFHSFKRL